MMRRILVLLCTFTAGAIVGHFGIPSISSHFAEPKVVLAQTHKPLMITHLYTGPDNQTHAEEVELKFTPGNPAEVSKMMPITQRRTPSNGGRQRGRLASCAAPPVRDHVERPWRGRSCGRQKGIHGAGAHRPCRRHDGQRPHYEGCGRGGSSDASASAGGSVGSIGLADSFGRKCRRERATGCTMAPFSKRKSWSGL